MRCRHCRKEIAGTGKPGLTPAAPAAVAIAGVFAGLWYLTLSQNPANPMPTWSPTVGWAVAFGGLLLASILASIGMYRRKCPECGSRQMLDAMEEESLAASERLAQKATVDGTAGEMAQGEAPVLQVPQALQAPQISDDSARKLRSEIEAELRSVHAKDTADQLAAQEKALRAILEEELRGRLMRELRPQVEHELRPILEEELRPSIERELRKTLESERKPEPEKAREADKEPRPQEPRPPVQPKEPSAAPARAPARTGVQAPGAWKRRVQPMVGHAKIDTAPISLKSSRPAAPPPVPAAAVVPPLVKTPTPLAEPIAKPAEPERPSQNVLTQAPLHEPATLPSTPSAGDGHERAKRRARVILSDLSLYHRELLLRAARADDAKAELGPIWRDAMSSYNEVVSPEIRNATNYLEEELQKRLAQLRQAEASASEEHRS